MTRRTPTGAAVLQPRITAAISEAVLDELAEQGYARLSMEAVARRAGVGKSALYRRWASKQEMALAVVSEFSVGHAVAPDTGSLRGDIRQSVENMMSWMSQPRFARILPDLMAEMARTTALGGAVEQLIGQPRRDLAMEIFHRAIDRGELNPETDLELTLDLMAAPIYWRLTATAGKVAPGYLDELAALVSRAIGV